MSIFNELKLAKELIRFPSVTPIDAGTMSFLARKLKFVIFFLLKFHFLWKWHRKVSINDSVYKHPREGVAKVHFGVKKSEICNSSVILAIF